MKEQTVNAVKLGFFVLSGLVLLLIALYFLGKNRSLFGSDLELKTYFRDVNGLTVGNNVRYSGIEVGTIRDILILNDTTIEVQFSLDQKMKTVIRSNAVASLGTDGLIGQRIINISPGKGTAPFIQTGGILNSKEELDTEAMLQTLHKTNQNIALISEELLGTLERINHSTLITTLLDDPRLSDNLRQSLANLSITTARSATLMEKATSTLDLASEGRGPLATLLTDTTMAVELSQTVIQFQTLENKTQNLASNLDSLVHALERDLHQGSGTVNALMQDSLMAANLRRAVKEAELGISAFNQNMEALKHNLLFRGYFRKQAKGKTKN